MPVPPDTPAPAPDTPLVAYMHVLTDANAVKHGPLQVLRIVRAASASLRRYEWEVAHAALEAGASYSELGRAIGMTKQGAQRRYSRDPGSDE